MSCSSSVASELAVLADSSWSSCVADSANADRFSSRINRDISLSSLGFAIQSAAAFM
jgi:hypothetical protein